MGTLSEEMAKVVLALEMFMTLAKQIVLAKHKSATLINIHPAVAVFRNEKTLFLTSEKKINKE